MNRLLTVALLFLFASVAAAGQPPTDSASAERSSRIRAILRAQDLRAGNDPAFRALLADPDPVIRERATLACGSLQDTTLLAELLRNLMEGPPAVQEAAAFAIGQTAGALSRPSADSIATLILDGPVGHSPVLNTTYGRMIEELGKFGSATHLERIAVLGLTGGALMDPESYLMAIARFAIRNITVPEAASFAVATLVDDSGPGWLAAYALQRIGDNAGVGAQAARITGALKHPDARARMNVAALFGKLKNDSTLVPPLAETALSDPDWRVRVNALKALGAHPAEQRIAAVLLESSRDSNESVALTAIGAAGGYGGKGAGAPAVLDTIIPVLRSFARGEGGTPSWRVRAAAASALAKLHGPEALPDLAVPAGAEALLTAGLIGAAGETGAPAAMETLAPFLASGNPLFRRTALEASNALLGRNAADTALRERAYAANIDALASGDMAVVTTAASNLGDSLLLRASSVGPLAAALGRLRPPGDIEAIQEACRTIAKLGDSSAAPALRAMIASGDPPAALAASTALRTLTGAAPAPPAPSLHTDFDFAYLESLPETIAVRLRTGRGEVVMEWYRDAAPFTIMSLLKLAEGKGFYRGLVFHRVVPNFVIQGGDPRGDGWGGPGYSVRSEFSALSYETGMVGIASAGKDTEGSQFFVTHSPQPHLDGRYTIIGRVVRGMDAVDAVQVGDAIVDLERVAR